MEVFFIRHGQSYVNLGNWQQLPHIDTPLTDIGIQQGVALREWLRATEAKGDVLYTSTLIRTRETADYVSEALGLSPIPDDRLREIGHSFADGRPMAAEELPKSFIPKYPGQNPYRPETDDDNVTESWMGARVRLGSFINHLTANHMDDVVYVVAHGGIIAAMIENTLNVPPVRNANIHTNNTGISRFYYEMTPHGLRWTFNYHNHTEHLIGKPELLT
jgi:probable phosphoglycerate mutase